MTADIDNGPLLISMIAVGDDVEHPTISRSLVVQQDFSWAVHIDGKKLTCNTPLLSTMPQLIDSVANIRD